MQLRWHPSSILALSGTLALILSLPPGITLSASAEDNPKKPQAQESAEPIEAQDDSQQLLVQNQPQMPHGREIATALSGSGPLRSPALLIDDLVEVAVHSQNTARAPGEGAQKLPAAAAGSTPEAGASAIEAGRGKSAAYQHVIPDVININYRPARAAAQIYMGHGSEDGAARQLDQAKYKDELTVLITSIMLDLATGLGEKTGDRKFKAGTIATSMARLSQLVGEQEAIWAFERLEKFSRSVSKSEEEEDDDEKGTAAKAKADQCLPVRTVAGIDIPSKFQFAWDVLGQQTLAAKIAGKAIGRDQTTRNLKARLGVHENAPNAFEKTLSLLSMIPEVVATAALVGDQVLEMSNGGTREKRLTDVMSLGLQLDSREATLSRQSYLAAASMNAGKLTGNQTLSCFAEALALQLAGQ